MPAIAGSNGAVEPLDSYEEDDFEEASGATLSDLFPNPETPNPEDMIEEIYVEENDEELLWKCPPPVVRLHHADVFGRQFGLTGDIFKKMVRMEVPAIAFNTLRWLQLEEPLTSSDRNIDYSQFYEGIGIVREEVNNLNPVYVAVGVEYKRDPVWENTLMTQGWLRCTQVIRRTQSQT